MNLVSRFHKSVLFQFSYMEELLTLEYLLLKIELWSRSVDVARWVRPAIEHAQDVLLWWVRPGVGV